jgi:hypothetical protein
MKTIESFEVKFNIKDGEFWKMSETKIISVKVNKGRKMFNKAEEKFLDIEDYREKILRKELTIVSITYQ